MGLTPLSPRGPTRPGSVVRADEPAAGAAGAFESLLARSTPGLAAPRGDGPVGAGRTGRPAGHETSRPAGHPAGAGARHRTGRSAEHAVDAGDHPGDRPLGGDSHPSVGSCPGHADGDAPGRPAEQTAEQTAALSAAQLGGLPLGQAGVSGQAAPTSGGPAAGPATRGSASGLPAPAAGAAIASVQPTGAGAGPAAGPAAGPTAGPADASAPGSDASHPASASGLTGLGAVLARTPAKSAGQPGRDARDASKESGTAAADPAATGPLAGPPDRTGAEPAAARSQPRTSNAHDGAAPSGDPGVAAATPVPTGPATGARTGEAAGAQPAAPNPVLDQVLAAVPRLVQRGDGTARLTLKLHPADLGEVHVTVTVKGGAVDVTLAAGARAREALGSGSDRLRSLLEGLGHTSGQVVVRDLPGVAATAPSSGSWGQSGQQPGQQPGQQGDLAFGGGPGGGGHGQRPGSEGGLGQGAAGPGRAAPAGRPRPPSATGSGRGGLDVIV